MTSIKRLFLPTERMIFFREGARRLPASGEGDGMSRGVRSPANMHELPRMLFIGNLEPPEVTSPIAPVQYRTCSTDRTGAQLY